MTITPIIVNPLGDITVNANDPDTVLNLSTSFDDPSTTGKTARFQLENTSLGNGGVINIVLFDQTGVGAFASVENFLAYVNAGSYTNSIIHRSIRNFVVQGGGFVVENPLIVREIPSNAPVQNEFSAERSNLRGTIAFAKQGNNPNSATNQWFFNLGDNSANLDNQNGGFTVFGQVLSNNDLTTIDAIASLRTVDADSPPAETFNNLPVINLPLDSADDVVRFSSITASQLPELQFTVINNSNPNLVNVVANGTNLTLDYLSDQSGSAEITVRATTLLGETIEDTFTVTVNETTQPEFDPAQYGASYSDLIIGYGYDLDGLTQHYFTAGIFEGRNPDNFDEKNYLASYDDLISFFRNDLAGVTRHYIQSGFVEERRTDIFNGSQYLASYNDLLTGLGNNPVAARDHFLSDGFKEGRSRDSFREDVYIASYADLIEVIGYDLEAGTQHYLNHGATEKRAKEIFDPVAYLNKYPDLQAFFGNDLVGVTRHYIEHGFGEGRTW